MKYYAVRRGRTIGIFDNWPDCDKSVRGFRRAEYKSFKHSSEAKRWFDCATDNQTTLDLWYPIDFVD